MQAGRRSIRIAPAHYKDLSAAVGGHGEGARAARGCPSRDRGVAVIVVEQDITRSLALADRFYCFLEGEVSMSGRPADADRETIMQHYFGA